MLALYRSMIRLYPVWYREEFGDEMLRVFADLEAERSGKDVASRWLLTLREINGLLAGALREHLRAELPISIDLTFPMRRFAMRNGFRFPKTTAVLMTIILAGVIMAIRKGEAIAGSLPNVSPPLAPIRPVPSTLLPGVVAGVLLFYAAGLIGWGIVFALRRSGVHRLDEISAARK
jgi:hypothetical protein